MNESLKSLRHARSAKDYPGLKLEDDEYVEVAMGRAKICFAVIWGGMILGALFIAIFFLFASFNIPSLDDMGRQFLNVLLLAVVAVIIAAGIISTIVFSSNRIYITNKRVIQFVMNSIFSKSVNMIDLASIEDISFRQNGVIETLFRFGTVRMATVGDETTYTFKYAKISPAEVDLIARLIREKKNANKAADASALISAVNAASTTLAAEAETKN